MSINELAILAGQITAIGAVAAVVYRKFINPKIIKPTFNFFTNVSNAVTIVENIEPQVAAMGKALGPNGGRSLADVIYRNAARLNLLLDGIDMILWEASHDGDNTRVNPAFERTFGYSAADVRGNGWKNLIHPDDAEEYFTAWNQAVRDQRQFRHTARFVTKDRRVVEVEVFASPAVAREPDHIIIWMGTCRITPPAPTLPF